MDKLFIAIRDKLAADVPEVKYFDWDNGQYDGSNQSIPVTPGVLMDIVDIPFEEVSRNVQMGEMTILLKCGFRIRGRSDSNAPADQQQTALEFLTTLKNIAKNIYGLTSENTTALVRSRYQRVQTDELKVYEIYLTCQYYEQDNREGKETVPKPPLEITEA